MKYIKSETIHTLQLNNIELNLLIAVFDRCLDGKNKLEYDADMLNMIEDLRQELARLLGVTRFKHVADKV